MKAVAFVCLLSLSLCLSQPAGQPEAQASPSQAAAPASIEKASPTEHKEAQTTIKTIVSIVTTPEPPHEKANKPAEQASPNETKPSAASTETKPATPEKKENSTKPEEPKKDDTKEKTPVKPSEETNPAEDSAKSTEKSKEAASTAPPKTAVTEKVTEAPKGATEKPMVTARGFDGPSFIGGIILTLGLLAIGFMGFKYYKNQTERNYHTL